MATREIEEWTTINQIAEEFLDDEDDEEDNKNKKKNIEEVAPVVNYKKTSEAPKMIGAESSSIDENGVFRLDLVAFEWLQKQQQLPKKETREEAGRPVVTTLPTPTTKETSKAEARAYALSGIKINRNEERKKQREEAKQTKIAARKNLFEPLTLEMVAKLSEAEKETARNWHYTYNYCYRDTQAEEARRRRRAKDFERNKLKMRVITKLPKLEPTFGGLTPSNTFYYPFLKSVPAESSINMQKRKNYPLLDKMTSTLTYHTANVSKKLDTETFDVTEDSPIFKLMFETYGRDNRDKQKPLPNKDALRRGISHLRTIIAESDKNDLARDIVGICGLLTREHNFLSQTLDNMKTWCKNEFDNEKYKETYQSPVEELKISKWKCPVVRVQITCSGYKGTKNKPLFAILPPLVLPVTTETLKAEARAYALKMGSQAAIDNSKIVHDVNDVITIQQQVTDFALHLFDMEWGRVRTRDNDRGKLQCAKKIYDAVCNGFQQYPEERERKFIRNVLGSGARNIYTKYCRLLKKLRCRRHNREE